MPKLTVLSFLLSLSTLLSAQEYDFSKSWEFLGPDEKPLEDKKQSATGIGPVEFIRANKKVKDLLLAGSLNGGLFYSTDGGEQWINAGSDDWPYSGCGWAEFHPDNEKVWFAYSCLNNNNGQPGAIGHQGGIYRTMDGGLNWEMVADKSAFINSEYITVYGFQFHPDNSNQLLVYTEEGLYTTDDCTAEKIQWKRLTDLAGWIYDVCFTENHIFISHMQFGKWNVFVAPRSAPERYKKLEYVEAMSDPIMGITFENYKDQILILTNFLHKPDQLHQYDPYAQKEEMLLRTQRVVFGSGRTFAVSPHRPDELMLGYSTTMKRWKVSEKANKPKMRGGYHVDLEFIEYDPFDSMKIYLGTHGGVYTSTDHGQSWVSTSKGIGVAEVEGSAVSPSDPDQIVIGCYHDGSTIRADWEGNGKYQWKNINGGDGLIPLLADYDPAVVYTSNQYTGGGLYYSNDFGKKNTNVHTKKGLTSSGWQMAAVLHPTNQKMLFFNYILKEKVGKGNVDIMRTTEPDQRGSEERISNFLETHGIQKYSVYGLYNSPDYPDHMYIHLIEFTKDENGKPLNVHRAFKTSNCTDSAQAVIDSWVEIEIPRSDWIAYIQPDPKKSSRLYIAYVAGIEGTELTDQDFGLVYHLKYKKDTIIKRGKRYHREYSLQLYR